MKKFNNWRRADGFTLVELIVVIAILAILGGVAVPAYSGYVEKAKYAADEALLAEVNTAFAAACAINGESHMNQEGASATIDKDGKVSVVAPNVDNFDASFADFYEGGGFKVMTALLYKDDIGMFVDNKPETYTDKKGNDWLYYQSNIDAYSGSNFDYIGIGTLLGTVDDLVGGLSNNNTSINSLKNSADFQKFMSDKGVDINNSGEVAAALATYTAQSVSGVSADALHTAISGATDANGKWNYTTALNNVSTLLFGSASGQFANKAASAAILYGLGTSYQESEDGLNAQIDGVLNLDNLDASQMVSSSGEFNTYMDNISSSYFDNYIQNNSKKDIEALLGAFDVVNNNYDVINDYRQDGNGYNNTNITDVIEELLGKK